MEAKFTRHRQEAPLLAAFFAIAAIELFIVHLLVSRWSPTGASILSAATLAFLAHMLLLVHGLVRWPTVIDEGGLTVRYGRRGAIFVPLWKIAGIENVACRPDERGPQIFRAAFFAHPNILVRLAEPLVHGRRRLEAITMRLDDPVAFGAALKSRLERTSAQALSP